MEKQELEKINSVFSNRTYNLFDLRSENDRDILDALKELSRFFPSNTSENRRNLRSVIEARSIAINKQFLDSFKKMENSLSIIYKNMNEMNDTLSDMRKNLSLTKKNTQTLIDKTMNLQKDIKIVSVKQKIASTVLGKFQLTPAELSSLRAVTLDPDMFSALEKSQDILNNCKTLMQIGWQVTAQDITEQMTLYQEAGMERLFRWTQGRCRNIEMRDPFDLLPRAMAKLQDRPELFSQILEEYSIHRRDVLVRQFIEALTGSSRGIELRATEPKRYVGDMLAWLHQAIPFEKDNLCFLLKNCENTDDVIQQTLGSINEGVCHPLKVRIEHVLFNEGSLKRLHSFT
ncbi:UNVERIFIED_CONTAM: hypothetical protein PYX00_009598 [Menopon gallinae]|uniref:Conserved oligomeric Golgi complex subunit 6 n=1 Tax=Menopon gallinae TaxID=328185 RepID=A0AAW2HC42_9NEOP